MCDTRGEVRRGLDSAREVDIEELIPIRGWDEATPLSALQAEPMPTELFYIRSEFGVPKADVNTWKVTVDGLVDAPQAFTLDELRALDEISEVVIVECAGNGRTLLDPLPEGVPWNLGAVSIGEFSGVPLFRVLEQVEPSDGVVEFVFTGADRGAIDEVGELNYAFSLAAETALGPGPLLVWGMNGEPLPPEHGGPLRLLVPNHYGMTSVKWLTSITAADRPFDGFFRERYRFFDHPRAPEGSKVDRMWVRSLITSPEDGALSGEELEVAGVAWSGYAPVVSVEVRVDEGAWLESALSPQGSEFAPVAWSAPLTLGTGDRVIAARATDAVGNSQPLTALWNRHGYANNVVHRIRVSVGPQR